MTKQEKFKIFDEMTVEEIHQLKRERDDDLRIHKEINEYFLNSERFNMEESVLHLEIEMEKYSNPYAIQTLAEFHRDGIFFDQSEEIYFNFLKRFVEVISDKGNYVRIAKDLYDCRYSGRLMMDLSVNDWIHLGDMGGACKQLGLYYAGFSEEKDLRSAEYYLRLALWNHFNVGDVLEMVGRKLELLADDQNDDLTDIDSRKILNNQQDILYEEVKKKLQTHVGDDNWNKLQEETKVYLITALLSYNQFIAMGNKVYNQLDFSGIISLLMRALEYELENHFYKEYLEYLKINYPDAREYLSENEITINKWSRRRLIVYKSASLSDIKYYEFGSVDTPRFSLGLLSGLIGFKDADNVRNITIDKTFFEYCKNSMKFGNSEVEIKNWIRDIIVDTEILRHKRNKAAHGGKVLNIREAKEAFDIMIWVKEVLKNLMRVKK